MFPSEDNDLNLSILPFDVIRKIIRVGQESIDIMQLISSHWNTLSLEHLADRKRLPVIERFDWQFDTKNINTLGLGLAHLKIEIPECFQNYFGLASWESCGVSDDTVDHIGRYTKSTKEGELFHVFLARMFTRCSLIETLSLDILRQLYVMGDTASKENIAIFNAAFNGVKVKKLELNEFWFKDRDAPLVLDLTQAYQVEHLALNASKDMCYLQPVPLDHFYGLIRGFFANSVHSTPKISVSFTASDQPYFPQWSEVVDKLNSDIEQCKATIMTNALTAQFLQRKEIKGIVDRKRIPEGIFFAQCHDFDGVDVSLFSSFCRLAGYCGCDGREEKSRRRRRLMRDSFRSRSSTPPSSASATAGNQTLFVVYTAVANKKRREVIRQTYGQDENQYEYQFCLFFFTGRTENPIEEKSLLEESATFKDIIVGDFVDSYVNMTNKALFWMRFVSAHCAATATVVKLDDDVAINLRAFSHRLPILQPNGIYGVRWTKQPVRRYISYSLYPFETFPPYVSGSSYIVTTETIGRLLSRVKYHGRYMHVDDVYTTGVLANSACIRVIDRAKWWNFLPNATAYLRKGEVLFALHQNNEDLIQLYKHVHMITDHRIPTYPPINYD